MTEATQERTQRTKPRDAGHLDRIIAESEKRKNVVGRAASFLGVRIDRVFDLLRGVIKENFSDDQLMHAVSLIARYGLDPFTKEIYVAVMDGGRIATVMGYDGWLKVCNQIETYDGFEFFETLRDPEDPESDLVSVEYVVHDTRRTHPGRYKARMRRWCPKRHKAKGGWQDGPHPATQWYSNPEHMLHIRAHCHAIRRTYSLGQVYVEGELDGLADAMADHVGDRPSRPAEPTPQKKRAPAKELVAEPKEEPEKTEPEVSPDDELWSAWTAERSKLTADQIKEIRRELDIAMINPSCSTDQLSRAIELAQKATGGDA